MELKPVESTNITHAGYDEENTRLGVRFKGGVLYHYLDVPAKVANEFFESSSKGSYLAVAIKPNFKVQRIVEKKEDES